MASPARSTRLIWAPASGRHHRDRPAGRHHPPIALRSIGFIGKLLYEAIEEIDERQVEADQRKTGASNWQVMDYAIVPQSCLLSPASRSSAGTSNIRESDHYWVWSAPAGIGVQLQSSAGPGSAWSEITVIFAAILVTVAFSEWVSAVVRKKIV